MQPVGELDQQHPGVVGDRQQKLAEVLRLLCMLGDEVELAELGQSVDQAADLLAERLVHVPPRGLGVLDRVVQHRRDDRRVVDLEIGQNGRDFERMRKIRIAGRALLCPVRLHRKDVGAVQELFIGVRIVAADPFHQFILPHHRRNVPTRLQRRIPWPCPRGASKRISTGLQGREMANARAGRGLPRAFLRGLGNDHRLAEARSQAQNRRGFLDETTVRTSTGRRSAGPRLFGCRRHPIDRPAPSADTVSAVHGLKGAPKPRRRESPKSGSRSKPRRERLLRAKERA